MTTLKFSAVLLMLWLTAPLLVNAVAYLPAQAPLVIPKQIDGRIDPSFTMFRIHAGTPTTTATGFSTRPVSPTVAATQRGSKWKQLVSLRKQVRKLRKSKEEMTGYERDALIWGAAGLFAAAFFIILGLAFESIIILGALLAIPFGIIALFNHRKAKKMGSERVAGAVMAISGMAIVGSLFLAFLILLAAWA